MKRKKSLLFLCLFLAVSCFAEDKQLDSLQTVLLKAKDDTSKVNTLIAVSKIYNSTNPDEAIKYGKKAIELSEKINFKKGLAFACKYTGIGYFNKGEYLDAIVLYEQSVAAFDSIGDKKGEANMYSNMGNIHFSQGDDVKANELYFKSLKLADEINDSFRIVTLLNNIGAVYELKEANYDKALHNLSMAYPLSQAMSDHGDPNLQQQKKDLIGTTAVNIGEFYLLKFKKANEKEQKICLDSALYYFEKSTEAYGEESENLPYTLYDIGKAYMLQKDYDKAINYQLKAIEKAKKLDAKNDVAIYLVGLAQSYQEKGEIKHAVETYLEAEKIANETGANYQLQDTYDGLAKGYQHLSDYRNAYQYAMLLSKIKETIFNTDANKKLGTLQFTYDLERKESKIQLLTKDQELKEKEISRQKLVRNGFIGGFAVVLLFAGVFLKQRNRIGKEKKRSDELLLNILPEETADELKATGTAKAKSFDLVTVMFTDFKNFTQASERLSPEDLVEEINHCYSAFDHIITKYGIEKIKTIGDAYMCAGGLPVTNSTHPVDVVKAGLEMQAFIARNKKEREEQGQPFFELRLGIHTGPVVAGIVGIKKFAYDIWGDTVNTASRMESSGETGKVNISETTYELIKDHFKCEHRGKIKAKNKGEIDMYFVEGLI